MSRSWKLLHCQCNFLAWSSGCGSANLWHPHACPYVHHFPFQHCHHHCLEQVSIVIFMIVHCLIHDHSSGPAWVPPPTPSCCPWRCVICSPLFCQHLGKLRSNPWIGSNCFISLFRYIFAFTFGGHASIKWTKLSCFLFEFSLETTPQIFHTASNWLTLGLAVQRYIYVCHVHIAKRFCTVANARLGVMCVMGLAVMHMVPRALDREYSIHFVGEPVSLSLPL